MTTPIVAGTDGSEESLAAVEWAAVEAVRRRVPLCVVHVVDHPDGPAAHARFPRHDRTDLAGRFRHDLAHRDRSALAGASRRAAEAAPDIDLRAAAVFGRADQALTAITAQASLLAIGTRGAGGLTRPRLGSVALRLATRARCPVVFAAAGSRPVFGEIVVGTGGSDSDAAAVEFGFGEADVRGARLTALHAWAHPKAGGLDGYHDWVLSVEPPNQAAAALLSEQITPWRHKYPDVIVTESAVHGHPGRVLALVSRSADLVVIGGRRDKLDSAPGIGPVSDAVLRHADCPVAVISGGVEQTPDDVLF